MIDKNKTKELLTNALKPTDMIEVGVASNQRGSTRFANSVIHQNMSIENPYIWTRVIVTSPEGKRIGGASSRDLSVNGVKTAIRKASEIASCATPDKEFASLPKPVKSSGKRPESKPQVVTPEQRASAVRKITSVCKKHKLDVAGVIHTSSYSLGVANNLGINQYGIGADTYATITAMADNSSGYASAIDKKFTNIDFEKLAEIACQKAILSKNPKEVEPGPYTVLLEPDAVAEFMTFLGWLEFGGKAFAEKRSIMSKSIGKKITGANITITDDYTHPKVYTFPFDYEGFPRKKVTFIDKGVAKGVVFDSFYANKMKKPNTGHALPQPNAYGPYPSTLIIKPGNTSMKDMLKMVDKGILITRFWYTRVVNPDQTLITGLTRDGTFWVENGEIKYGIKNLRYTINIYETLKNVLAISKETVLSGEFTQTIAPAMLIKNFTFTGKTQY